MDCFFWASCFVLNSFHYVFFFCSVQLIKIKINPSSFGHTEILFLVSCGNTGILTDMFVCWLEFKITYSFVCLLLVDSFLYKWVVCGFSCCCLERMSVQLLSTRLIRLWRRQTTETLKLALLIEHHFVANISLVRDIRMAISWHRKDLARNAFTTRFVAVSISHHHFCNQYRLHKCIYWWQCKSGVSG